MIEINLILFKCRKCGLNLSRESFEKRNSKLGIRRTCNNCRKSAKAAKVIKGMCVNHKENPTADGYKHCGICLENQKVHRETLRQEREEKKLCFICGKNPFKLGTTICEICSKKSKLNLKIKRENAKLNRKCLNHPELDSILNSTFCSECHANKSRKAKERAALRKLQGVCVKHPNVKAKEGFTQCEPCLSLKRTTTNKNNLYKPCNKCGKRTKGKYNTCKSCRKNKKDSIKEFKINCKLLKICPQHPEKSVKEGCNNCEECVNASIYRSKIRRSDAIKTGNCVAHKDRKAVTKGNCEECWFRGISAKNLGSTKFSSRIKSIFESQLGKCAISGRDIFPGNNASLDHIIPVSSGGNNKSSNLQWICIIVNFMKMTGSYEDLIRICYKIVNKKETENFDFKIIEKLECMCTGSRCRKNKSCTKFWFLSTITNNLGNILLKDQLIEIYNTQRGICPLTGDFLVPGVNMSLDHIIPRARGGTNEISNLRWVTQEANRVKFTMSDSELILMCKDIILIYEKQNGK